MENNMEEESEFINLKASIVEDDMRLSIIQKKALINELKVAIAENTHPTKMNRKTLQDILYYMENT